MKKIFTFILSISALFSQAQIGGGWDWAFNTGSLGGTTFKHMKYNAAGTEILMGGQALAAAYFGSNTLTAPPQLSLPGNIKFFGKIDAATGASTIIRSFINIPVNFDCITTDDAGNFYIGGASVTTTDFDFGNGVTIPGSAFKMGVIAKFDATGNTLWAKTFQMGAVGAANNQVLKLAVANSGNIVFWGFNPNSTTTTAPYNRNSPLYKLDNNGNILWYKDAINGSNTVGNTFKELYLSDKFIDKDENVYLFVSTSSASGYTFNGVAYPGGSNSYGSSTLISLNAAGVVTKAQTLEGGVSHFQVNRNNGNFIFGWTQLNANPGAFQNLPHPLGSVSPFYANAFTGMIETNKNLNFIKAKDYSTAVDNPFTASINNDKFLSLPNGKMLIATDFYKTVAFYLGVNSGYPADPTKYGNVIIETDTNWNMDKFITGGKAPSVDQTYLAAYNDTYLLGAGFYAEEPGYGTANPPLPTTSFGTVNLTGFNAASNMTTAYGTYSTSSALRYDVAIAQTKSPNFPTIPSTTWLGTTNNWNTESNWSNGVPTNTVKAVFTAGASNYPTVSSTPTAATLEINSGVTLSLPTTLTLVGGIKNNGVVVLNNAGFFQGLGSSEWKGTGSVNFTGTAVNFFYGKAFTNSLVLDADVSTFYNLTVPSVTFNTGKFNLNNKRISISEASPTAISGAKATSYFYGGTLLRAVNASGTYEFPVGSFDNFQSATVSTNSLAGVSGIAVNHTSGAVTGTPVNATLNGVSIIGALNGGWYTATPNAQPTNGTYNMTLKLKGSTNTVLDAAKYALVKRDNSTSDWAVNGTYVLPTTDGSTITITANGLTSFSDFAIGIANSILPVTLTTFTAQVIGDKTQLAWGTAAEVNNKGFNVQHSVDGITYKSLGFVNSKGTSVTTANYTFIHNSPVKGKNYYRLQQVDKDGLHRYSTVQAVTINQLQTALSIYPNPVVSTISFNRNFAAGTTLQIINAVGQVVEQSVFSGNQYKPKTTLKGVYRLAIKTASDTIVATITTQ